MGGAKRGRIRNDSGSNAGENGNERRSESVVGRKRKEDIEETPDMPKVNIKDEKMKVIEAKKWNKIIENHGG